MNFAISIIKKTLILTTLFTSLSFQTSAHAEDYKSRDFLNRTEQERKWFYMGAFMTLGQVISQRDQKQAECVWNWYFKNPAERTPTIESHLSHYADHAPTAVFIGLLQKACGKF